MIEASGLSKKYGEFHAVSDLSFSIAPGEIVGLVGPNGAGKTTTLRCLTGIIPPTTGKITIGGFDLQEHPIEAKRQFAYVADEPKLFDYLTVIDHLSLIGRLYNVGETHERAEKLLGEFDLDDRRLAYPSELSRGMKQKLLVAMALLHEPRLLVLDEPLTGLDPLAMRRMRERIREAASTGVSVILSSHMLQLVEELCDRILILRQGKKLAEGSLDEIRTRLLPELGESADLEEVFLRATQTDADE
ncbi:MAG: ABC transporter ATP-binding protein [Acidobacteriota bacterium]|nr:ABC transporter ATP-binding protein [Acidobacteriota bacterium]MDH3783762.1 ABC transporter ATP-binding protein [Acidobacteriota bacterium]